MKIGFFGCGNMGRVLAGGFKRANPEVVQYFYSPGKERARLLSEEVSGIFIDDLETMPRDLDWYILAFKPQSLSSFEFSFSKSAHILSVLAGVSVETIKNKFQNDNVARLMPNTPSAIGFGANLFYSSFDSSEMRSLLESLGKLFIMSSEDEIDSVTPFSGSGPALIFEFARIFEMSLAQFNVSHPELLQIIAQTFLGSAKLMEKALLEGTSLERLRDQVTSKKGVTYEALKVLENNHFDKMMEEAFLAAHKRTIELKKGI